MAKRRRKQTNNFRLYNFIEKYRPHLMKGFWAIALIICALFGYSRGYPIAAAGEIWNGILIGLAYGGGAFIAIFISFYLNRKLKGL